MKQKSTTQFPSEASKEIAYLDRKGKFTKETARCLLLDTNFIITCIKQKIDFFEEIPLMGIKILLPKQVINELKKLNTQYSKLALKLIEKSNPKIIDIGKGHVDKKILKYVKENPKTIVATLDKELKSKLKSKMVIRERKRLDIV